MAIPTETQLVVWGFSNEQLSKDATITWQYMADADQEWETATAAADISSGLGGTLSSEEVAVALQELEEKDLITSSSFKVAAPSE